MTLHGKPALKQGAREKLGSNCGKRGAAIVSIDMAGEADVIVFRWHPPRTYDTTMQFLQQHFEVSAHTVF